MAKTATPLLTPVGRFVGGSLYAPRTKDMDGKPLVGKDKVTPRVDYSIGIAIKKGAETHWNQTPWGQIIHSVGTAGWPNGQALAPTFAWKITDGDSQIPNKKGIKPASREGYAGHWVLYFSSGFAPKICNADGSAPILEKDAVKPGYYIQIAGNVNDNNPAQSPGVYLNLLAVAMSGYGPEIATASVDTASVGFGGALPAGASAVPAAAFVPPAVVAVAPALAVVPSAAALGMPMPAAPVAPLVAPAPVAPPAAPVFRMLPPAGNFTREQYHASGWTDETLIANGYMAA